MELVNAKIAREITDKVNTKHIESIVQNSIKEAIDKGYYHCYITFDDMYAAIDAMTILKEKGYKYRQAVRDQLCYKIEW